jgi:hypothetical protein
MKNEMKKIEKDPARVNEEEKKMPRLKSQQEEKSRH